MIMRAALHSQSSQACACLLLDRLGKHPLHPKVLCLYLMRPRYSAAAGSAAAAAASSLRLSSHRVCLHHPRGCDVVGVHLRSAYQMLHPDSGCK